MEEDFPRSKVTNFVLNFGKKDRKQIKKQKALGEPTVVESTNDKPPSDALDKFSYRTPRLETITVGSLVLGSVALVTSTGIRVHTLNNIVGFVKNADMVEDPAVKTASVPFSIGSNVVCYVLEVKNGQLVLSMKPSLINRYLSFGNLAPGVLLPSTVISHQDHGVMVSFNVEDKNGLEGFVMYDEREDGEEARESVVSELVKRYPVSSTAYVVVTSVNEERKIVKCKWPWLHKSPVSINNPLSFDAVKPGLLLHGEVSKVHEKSLDYGLSLPTGYTISCLGSLSAYIPASDSLESFKDSDEASDSHEPSMHDKVTARVTYIDSAEKRIHVSLLSHLIKWKGPSGHARKAKGLSNTCKVVKNIPNYGLVLLINNESGEGAEVGFAGINDVIDKSRDMKIASVLSGKTYAVGTVHSCRILQYSCFSRWNIVSLKESLLNEQYVDPLELSGGDVVDGKITKVLNNGVIVEISTRVHGSVPISHLTQVPLTQIPDRFHVGKTLKLRVLRFDYQRNKLILTAKEILTNDPNPLVKFENVYVGRELIGYVSSTNSKVTLRFYNNLYTVLDSGEIDTAKQHSIDLSEGCVVKSVVKKVDHARRKFFVTLNVIRMNQLSSTVAKKRKEKKMARKEICKKKFTNYKSSKKNKKSAKPSE
ncbi:hypothetical protein BEWA_032180 [Theileria equi strain WA]|uniref:S1 motif domain-containing protein n=1 Tax=Theileria equi strain WA TaxID=1537102 RepID=L0AXS9_THEEQ|nr:hypothetical protein BEWA_032180 [Theileria equi strain WA]AFZ80365.1 hypothetical protein BEWA_032180 [Theileria equi strain WA]|eukprot:XP_004830031.1 hypothetical protein BEWA_032180 [Theileria equi strain WA]